MIRWLVWAALCLSVPQVWGEDVGDELLPPEQAFRLQARIEAPGRLITSWQIAPGYYLYRDKLQFRVKTPGYELDPPELPPGEVKHDEFFGDVEVYRGQLRVPVSYTRAPAASQNLRLEVVSQGCADLGVCYPPQAETVSLVAPPAAQASPAVVQSSPVPAPPGPLSTLVAAASGGDEEFLAPDEAFKVQVEPVARDRLIARWSVAEGYYLYRDKMRFSLEDSPGVTLGPPSLPPGKIKHDEFFGDVAIYDHDLSVTLPLRIADDSVSRVGLKIEYQGCAKAGICYPPQTRVVEVALPGPDSGAGAQRPVGGAGQGVAGPSGPEGYQSEQDRIAQTLASSGIWLTIAAFFGFGLLLAFTPCVFPMIPILSGIIVGQGKEITPGKAFGLSLVYVLAMALTYTVVGVIVGLSGENVQAVFQNPWVLGVFAGIFVLLSLSMFGFYELQMPSAVQSRLSRISGGQRGGTLIGAGIMGFLSALIVGPCVTAPLIGALMYIASTGNAVTGGIALFSLSLGMGAPLLLIGTSAGRLLPRAGPWMEPIKAVFGVLLLGVAIWLLERILPLGVIMVLAGTLAIASSIYMGALEAVPREASGWRRLWKGLGLVLLIYGASLIIGALAGGHGVLQPLRGVAGSGPTPGTGAPSTGLEFRSIKGVPGLESALQQARAEGRVVMLDFYADWCVSCKEMESFTFTDPQVVRAAAGMLLLQADVTANDAQDKALLKRFGLFGPPAILFFAPDGGELRDYRVVGFMPAAEFSRHLARVRSQGGG